MEISEYNQLPNQGIHPGVEKLSVRLNTLQNERDTVLDNIQQKRTLAYAAVMTDPRMLPDLAKYFNTTVNIASEYAREAMENPELREMGKVLIQKNDPKHVRTEEISDISSGGIIYEAKKPKQNENLPDYFTNLITNPDINVTERETQLIQLFQSGLSNDEVAQIVGLTQKTTIHQLSRLRRKLENEELLTRGIERVASRGDNSLVQAVINGTLSGYMFLNMYYAYTQDIEKFIVEKKIAVDPEMIAGGYMLVTDLPDKIAKKLYTPRYRRHMIRHQNVIYVPNELIEKIETSEISSLRDFSPPQEGMVRIKDWALSNADYQRLWKAARKGTIPAQKNQSGWYAAPEDLTNFLNNTAMPRS